MGKVMGTAKSRLAGKAGHGCRLRGGQAGIEQVRTR
jgi:hypothetical protein